MRCCASRHPGLQRLPRPPRIGGGCTPEATSTASNTRSHWPRPGTATEAPKAPSEIAFRLPPGGVRFPLSHDTTGHRPSHSDRQTSCLSLTRKSERLSTLPGGSPTSGRFKNLFRNEYLGSHRAARRALCRVSAPIRDARLADPCLAATRPTRFSRSSCRHPGASRRAPPGPARNAPCPPPASGSSRGTAPSAGSCCSSWNGAEARTWRNP